jgi:hypothetical protein
METRQTEGLDFPREELPIDTLASSRGFCAEYTLRCIFFDRD